MAAAGDAATVFLETSLGTRLVVSFPAPATTVADLKRQVSAEHAACFPQIGPIAVESLQVKHDGSLFHLTDSMVVQGAFRWVNGPWQLVVEARELRSHSLAREDADCESRESEQNAGHHVVRASTQNTRPATPQGGGDLAIGGGISGTRLMNQLDGPHEGIKNASNQLRDENTMPRESSDFNLSAGGSGTPAAKQKDQSHEGVEQAPGQGRDGIVKNILMGSSDFYFAAVGSDNLVDLLEQSVEGVKRDPGQHKDGSVRTMLEESSDNLVAGESDNGAKNQLEKSHEDVEHASSLCENDNAQTLLQESSELEVAAGEGENPSMNKNNSYKVVKHASGQHKDENVAAMLQEETENDLAAGADVTLPTNQLDKHEEGLSDTGAKNQMNKSHEDVEHDSSLCENGNAKTLLRESSDLDVAAGEGDTPLMNQQGNCYEGVMHASGQHKDENVDAMLQGKTDNDVAAGEDEASPMNQLDQSHKGVKHSSGQHENGNITIILDESSDSDVAPSEIKTPPKNHLDTSHEDVRYASGQRKDGTVNIMLQKRSDLDESAVDKDNGPVQGQQKEVNAEPTGAKCFRNEDKNNENIIANCDDNISSLAISTVHINLAEEKGSTIEQENLNSSPLVYNQGNCSNGMGEKPSCSQKEPWTSEVYNGESRNNVSDILPCVGSMNRDNSSNGGVKAHRGVEEEPWVAGLCSGETSFKRTDGPHCLKSMRKGKKRPASNDQFVEKRKHEGATSTISTEHETHVKRRQRLTVCKVRMSRVAKMYGFRC